MWTSGGAARSQEAGEEGPGEGNEEQVGRRAMRKISVRILPTTALAGVLLMLDNSNMAFIASLLQADLGISTSGYGLLHRQHLFFGLAADVEIPS